MCCSLRSDVSLTGLAQRGIQRTKHVTGCLPNAKCSLRLCWCLEPTLKLCKPNSAKFLSCETQMFAINSPLQTGTEYACTHTVCAFLMYCHASHYILTFLQYQYVKRCKAVVRRVLIKIQVRLCLSKKQDPREGGYPKWHTMDHKLNGITPCSAQDAYTAFILRTWGALSPDLPGA